MKRNKHSKLTANSFGFGIANVVTTKIAKIDELTNEAAEAAWAILEAANALQQGKDKQVAKIMEMFNKLI